MIPCHIHQFLGNSGAQDSAARRIDGWRSKNPRFEHTLWSTDLAGRFLADTFGPVAEHCFYACELPSVRSALFGVAIVFVRGGVYVDPYIECRETIDHLLDRRGQQHVYCARREERCLSLPVHPDFGFIAGESGVPFLGRLLAALLNSVLRGELIAESSIASLEILSALHTEAAAAESQSVEYLEPHIVRHHLGMVPQFDPHDFSDDTEGDSFRAAGGKIVQRSEMQAPPSFRWAGHIFLGHPRCGSGALAAMLTNAGLRVGHERLKEDGVVTWWHTGRRIPRPLWPLFTSGANPRREIWIPRSVFHYLRNPHDAIPSIALENENNQRMNNSFNYRRLKLLRIYGIDIGGLDVPAAAVTSYALWNKLAEDIGTAGQVLVERPNVDSLALKASLDTSLRRNSSERKFGKAKPEIDLKRTIARAPGEVRQLMERYLDLYEEGGGGVGATGARNQKHS